MNYMKIYHDICNIGKERGVKTNKGFELHHVIPASYFKSRKIATYNENLALLTPKEHYVVHHLLAKTGCKHGIRAFWMMKNIRGLNLTAKEFEILRHNYYDSNKGRKAWNKGIALTLEQRQKISITMKGFKHSEETKQKMSESRMGSNNPMFGKSAMKGKTRIFSEEHRKNLSIASKGKKRGSYKKNHHL